MKTKKNTSEGRRGNEATNRVSHTPTPWSTVKEVAQFVKSPKGVILAEMLPLGRTEGSEQANAEFIVRAVNNQTKIDELVEAWDNQKKANPRYRQLPTSGVEDVLRLTGATESFIKELVVALNSHEALLEALKTARNYVLASHLYPDAVEHFDKIIEQAEGK